MNAVLSALATANPKRYATQEEIYAFLVSHFAMQAQEKDLYRQLLMEGPIRGRHIAVDGDEEICSQDPDCLIRRFATHSRRIAAEAAQTAMNRAGLERARDRGPHREHVHRLLVPGPILLSGRGLRTAGFHLRARPDGHGLRRGDPEPGSRPAG